MLRTIAHAVLPEGQAPPGDDVVPIDEPKRLFLRAGDTVYHMNYRAWGVGRVVELITSTLPGGCALARVEWTDGKKRVFNNDLDHYQCCYFFGLRLHEGEEKKPARVRASRRRMLPPAGP
jgi:hypothetical protein